MVITVMVISYVTYSNYVMHMFQQFYPVFVCCLPLIDERTFKHAGNALPVQGLTGHILRVSSMLNTVSCYGYALTMPNV